MRQNNQQADLPRHVTVMLVVALLLGAWFLRITRFDTIPPGIESDTTWDMRDALHISRGLPLPLDFDTRPEPAHRYLLAAWFVLTGPRETTARLLQACLGMLTIAATYRGASELLRHHSWQRAGSLVAAATLAATVAHIFLSRTHYRVILVSLVVALSIWLLLRAADSHRSGHWSAAGLCAGLGLHTYIAGVVTPLWAAAFACHRFLFPSQNGRSRWQEPGSFLLGMLTPIMIWAVLIWSAPDLYARVSAVSRQGAEPSGALIATVADGLLRASNAFYLTGFPHPLYNTPTTPFLNPILAGFAGIGLVASVWYWRNPRGAILLGGLVAFSLPGALSREPTHSTRLVGTMPILALLAGWGAAWLAALLEKAIQGSTIRYPQRWACVSIGLGIGLVTLTSFAHSYRAYFGMFADQAEYAIPNDWLGIPHNYTLALVESMEYLETATVPTYVPLSVIDNPASAFILKRQIYPHVTTWESYGLSSLPAGEVFYPAYGYFHNPTPSSDRLQALLLPDEGTIILLPPAADLSPVIEKPTAADGKVIRSRQYGWEIGWAISREASPLPDLSEYDFDQAEVTMGEGLSLVGTRAGEAIPAEAAVAAYFWRVDRTQPAGISQLSQLLQFETWAPVGTRQAYLYSSIYPSAAWQPGDIIPVVQRISVSPETADGLYFWGVSLYTPPKQERIPITLPRDWDSPLRHMWFWNVVRIPSPIVGQPLPSKATPFQAMFDDHIRLEGYYLTVADDIWTIELYWRAAGDRPVGDYTIFVHLSQNGQIVAQQDIRPQGGLLPTWAWQPGELITTVHPISIQADALPDEVYVGLYSFPSLERLAIADAGNSPDQDGRILIWRGQE